MRVSITFSLLLAVVFAAEPSYKVGVGISDITGPAFDVNMMGYASFTQNTLGIHLRLFSRAFITCNLNDTTVCNVFVSADFGMASTVIKSEVVKKLQAEYDGLYNDKNVAISGTHTHSGPGGYIQYSLYTITAGGFKRASFDAIVEGIFQSIKNAHNNLQDGNISYNKGDLTGVSVNRSPTAYLNNPKEERDRYSDNVDKEMTILKFEDTNGVGLGVICWFAVHPVSMENTNKLISSDNKGYASYLFEKEMNPGSMMGQGSFVAAFPTSNHGDTTPHVNGTICIDTGELCDEETSTCNGQAANCIGQGPGNDMFENTKMIGQRLYSKAKELYSAAGTQLSGPVSFVHQYVNMSNVNVTKGDDTFTTCTPALGYSFAAGTTDGPGIAGFTQGMTEGTSFFDALIRSLFNDFEETQKCQEPKPVLLPAGDYINTTDIAPALELLVNTYAPPPMVPDIVATQLLQIGQFIIIPVPGEFTTMAGRRLMEMVKQEVMDNGISDAVTMITGLSNTYTNYVTTIEEYKIQRYEGASTLYGQYTLDAYLQQYTMLADYMIQGIEVESGPEPTIKNLPLNLDFETDVAPPGKTFGSINKKPDPKYRQGSLIEAFFWSTNPNRGSTISLGTAFLSVEKWDGNNWIDFATDADWDTQITWKKESEYTHATVQWMVPLDAELGLYRLVHNGFYKTSLFAPVRSFKGASEGFEIVSKDYVRPRKAK
ncbi:putative neutral ceramidase C [Asterias amurensis]|uniref:putative neutral ceramidase C n=1 Tax=Asterias amurensis TaxID=7602 RepID=UPI003AB1551F